MTNNSKIFIKYLKSKNINIPYEEYNDGVMFGTTEPLKTGGCIDIALCLDKNDNYFSIIGSNFPYSFVMKSKRNEILNYLNELNIKYDFYKFIISDNRIMVQITIYIKDNFEPQLIMHSMLKVIEMVEKESSKIESILKNI